MYCFVLSGNERPTLLETIRNFFFVIKKKVRIHQILNTWQRCWNVTNHLHTNVIISVVMLYRSRCVITDTVCGCIPSTCLLIRCSTTCPPKPSRRRTVITLVLRELVRSILSPCSIQYNHSFSLMRATPDQTDSPVKKDEALVAVFLFVCFFPETFVQVKLCYRFVI